MQGEGGGRWLSNCVQIPPTPIHMHKPSLVLLPVTPATKTALRGVEKRKVFVHISLLICDLMPFNLYFLLVTANICFSNTAYFLKFLKNEVNDMYRGILLHDRNHFSKIGSYYCANIISKHVLRNKVPHKYLHSRMKSANIIPITYLYLPKYIFCLFL